MRSCDQELTHPTCLPLDTAVLSVDSPMRTYHILCFAAGLLAFIGCSVALPGPSLIVAARATHPTPTDALYSHDAPKAKRMTNGERLARGLPPNKPVRNIAPGQMRARAPGAAPHPPPAPLCTVVKGNIGISYVDITNHRISGYLSHLVGKDGSIGTTPERAGALSVSFNKCRDSTDTALDILSHHGYLTGTPLSVAGKPISFGLSDYIALHTSDAFVPQAKHRRGFTGGHLQWSIDGTGIVHPQWMHPDKSSSPLWIVHDVASNSVILTHDVKKYVEKSLGRYEVKLHFLPA